MLQQPDEHRGEDPFAGGRRNGERFRWHAEMFERRPVPFDNGGPGDRLQLLPTLGDLPENLSLIHI